jgi:MFS family permease
MTTDAASTDDTVSPRAWGLLGYFTFLNVLNFVDRLLIAALAPLLIADLGLNRAEIGLLAGFGFVFFYTFVGLFLGFAADRWRRMPIVALGLAIWSGMTALSGAARSFLQLAMPRIFVGVGEATLTPAALSMLGDVFPARRLATASGIYYAGIPLGSAVSMIASSYIAPRYGWRACFLVLGGIGLAAVAGLALFREPTRRVPATAVEHPPVGKLIRDLFAALGRRRELLLVLVGGSLLCYGAAAALLTVTWLVEQRGFPFAKAAFTAGVIGIFAGFLGNVTCGAFGDSCARRRENGHVWSLIPLTVVYALSAGAFYLLPPSTPLFFVFWFLTAALTSGWFGPLFAAIQELSPAHTRASGVALALLVLNLLGVGPGPLVTGFIGDRSGLTAGLLSSVGVIALAVVPFALAARRTPRST